MLMAIFVADIQKDIDTIDDTVFLQIVFFCGLVVLVASAVFAKWHTRKAIRCDPRATIVICYCRLSHHVTIILVQFLVLSSPVVSLRTGSRY